MVVSLLHYEQTYKKYLVSLVIVQVRVRRPIYLKYNKIPSNKNNYIIILVLFYFITILVNRRFYFGYFSKQENNIYIF